MARTPGRWSRPSSAFPSCGLARGGVTEPLTTEQIEALKQESPEWLQRERTTQAEVRKEAVRIKEKNAERAEKAREQQS